MANLHDKPASLLALSPKGTVPALHLLEINAGDFKQALDRYKDPPLSEQASQPAGLARWCGGGAAQF